MKKGTGMRSDFELDSQLQAYEWLLLNELKPEHIAESLLLKPAEQWMLDLERGTASLAAAWQQVCGISKYNNRYLLSNLKRHISISGSLQKTLTRYEGMLAAVEHILQDVCRQVYNVLGNCLADLQLCMQQELEQLTELTGVNAWLPKEETDPGDALKELEYKRGFSKFRLITRHDLRIIALLWGVMLEAGVYVCNHGDKKKIFGFLARHLCLEHNEDEMASRNYLLNQSTSKDKEILDAVRELIMKMLAYVDWVITLVTKGRK